MVDLLPSGWKGFLLAGFAAAYMSTIGTHLNWGASYLVNDVYRRFLKKDATEKHYVLAARLTTVLLFLASIVVTLNLQTIAGAWLFLLALGSGTGLVLILRWYWWRINAWSEISAMGASMVVSLTAMTLIRNPFPRGHASSTRRFRIRALVMLVTVAVSTGRSPGGDLPDEAGARRARSARSAGASGRAGQAGQRLAAPRLGREPIPGGAMSLANWILGILLVYAALFGIGKLVFGQLLYGFLLVDTAIVAFFLILWNLRRDEKIASPSRLEGPPPGMAP
jgi:Na+/proline symporter